MGPLGIQPGAWGKEDEIRVGEILNPLITLVVGHQASMDVTIRKVGQCTTVQVQTRRERRVRHVETTKITTAS